MLPESEFPLCPKSGPSTARPEDDFSGIDRHLLFDRCNSWDCPFCSIRKISELTSRIKEVGIDRFVTLTTKATDDGSPELEHKKCTKRIPQLIRKMDDGRTPKTEYLRVLELTKRGWPHYHFLTRGPFWDQQQLSRTWKQLTGAHIVDIRRFTGSHHVNYVAKYIQKGLPIEWARRRFAKSKNFMPPRQKPPSTYSDFVHVRGLEEWDTVAKWYRGGSQPVSKTIFRHHENQHPYALLWWMYREIEETENVDL